MRFHCKHPISLDANGVKLVRSTTTATGNTTAYYVSGIQYNYDRNQDSIVVSFVQTEDGRVFPYSSDSTNYYEYNLADYLGNNRIAFDNPGGNGATLEQQDDYMPFGLEISGTVNSPKNEYLYNGKELQEGFLLYDYGARFLDPVTGRWTTVDNLAEHPDQIDFSPYHYVKDNPIRYNDPDGNCPICIVLAGEALEAVAVVVLTALGMYGLHAIYQSHQNAGYNPVMSQDAVSTSNPAIRNHILKSETDKPAEPYDRKKHYGNTPTKSDRKALDAKPGEVIDHDPELVKRYYEGDQKTGEKPGHQMTEEERKKSANDRSRMKTQDQQESNQQGGKASKYSKDQKKLHGF